MHRITLSGTYHYNVSIINKAHALTVHFLSPSAAIENRKRSWLDHTEKDKKDIACESGFKNPEQPKRLLQHHRQQMAPPFVFVPVPNTSAAQIQVLEHEDMVCLILTVCDTHQLSSLLHVV
jgi:hypothetical protein